jgi:hypothetical protein
MSKPQSWYDERDLLLTEGIKYCPKCDTHKPVEEFGKYKSLYAGLTGCCKECKSKKHKRSYERHKGTHLGYARAARNKKWIENNKDKHIKYQKEYRDKNKERLAAYRQTPEYRKMMRKHDIKRYNDNRLRCCVSGAIRKALTRNKGGKDGHSVLQYLPYTLEELKEHLENQFLTNMSWKNYGEWHIDHIYPQSKLPFDSMEHPNFLKCWSLTNLQPLWAIDNIKKGNTT